MSLLKQFAGSGSRIPGALGENAQPGTTVAGTVTEVSVKQAMSYVPPGSSEEPVPLVFKDGQPKMQFVITVDTAVPHPDVETYEGTTLRRFHVKMWYKSDRESLIGAVTRAGDDDVSIGGWFSGRYDGYGVDDKGKPAAWKVHTYDYRKPSALAQASQAAPAEPAPQADTHVAQPTAVVTLADPVAAMQALAEKLRPFRTLGYTDAQIAASAPAMGVTAPDGSPLTEALVSVVLGAA